MKIGDHIATINNTVAVELRIGGIFLPRNRPTLGHQLQSQTYNCWISLGDRISQLNEVG